MEQFLDQSIIDEFVAVQQKKLLAQSAKEKLWSMYMYTLGYPTLEKLDSLSSIGLVIADISGSISESSEYYPSFIMLKNSYFNILR